MEFALPALVITLVLLRSFVLKARDRDGPRSGRTPWHHLFEGAHPPGGRPPDLVVISAVVEEAGQPLVLVGVLTDYFMDAEGRLDRLVLAAVSRCDRNGVPQPSLPIDGDYLVLRYAQVRSLSVRYVEFDLPAHGEAGAGDSRRAEPPERLDLLAA
ncbi:MAG TPA: hypothetical protein VM687_02335 [Stenotrophomonas sp.]|nr:hypothetical protein [Stenotrophomonas sp.]